VKPHIVVTTAGLLTSALLTMPSPTAAAPTQARVAAAEVVNGTIYRPVGPANPPPRVQARAWIVVDMATGAVLGKHRAHARLPQASTMKLLTALTATHRISATRPLRATRLAARTICSCAGVVAGRRYTRDMLLGGMLVKSGNDAAEALAGADPQGRARFIGAMNRTADRLGATETVARNASGLDATGAHSSARDLVVLLRAAARRDPIKDWLDRRRMPFGPIGGRTHPLRAVADYMLLHEDSYAAKSGYTTRARNTLVAASRIRTTDPVTQEPVTRDIGVSILGAEAGFTTRGARRLVVWAANNRDRLGPVGLLPGS
jgi:serine-type D-Ala-D-Ala carboxypeptidase (penicillin-binding protein 5/6)